MFEVMLDNQSYNTKPSKEELKIISKRTMSNLINLTAEELAEELTKGKSFIPANLNGRVELDSRGISRRSQANWVSQQIVCLDFDNQTFIPDPIDNQKKIKTKHVTMTWEDAKVKFKNKAMFMYKSFSDQEGWPKFRVVFAFEKLIEDIEVYKYNAEKLLETYPEADESSVQPNRLFFGGKNLYIFDYNNRISVENIDYFEGKGGLRDYDSIRYLIYHRHANPQNHENKLKNIELIKHKNVDALRNTLNREERTFYTYAEMVDYIKQQDIRELLELNTYDNCPFHHDHSSSASIYKNNETGHYLFHCHSEGCTFGTGNIVKVIERLTKLNKVQSLRFLNSIYNIKLKQTQWQKEQLELIDENIRYLQSGYMEIEYPKQYKVMKNYIPELIQFLTLSKEYIPPEHYSEDQTRAIFFASLSHFAKMVGKSDHHKKRLGDKLSLFAYFSYLHKLRENEIPEELLKRAKLELVKKKRDRKSYNLINFFEIPSYSEEILSFAEKKADEYINNHFTMRGWSYEMLLRTLGEEEASRVYPQMGTRKIKESSHELTGLFEKTILSILSEKKWVSEKEVLERVMPSIQGVSKTALDRQMKKIIGELLQKYDLIRIQSNKEVFKKLESSPPVNHNGYMCFPNIIIDKGILEK